MTSNPIIIDIVSDVVCPWCWYGKKQLDRALEQHPDLEVQINWHPYMLDPTVPAEGVPYNEYMRKKFGGGPSNRFKAMREHLEAGAGPLGITFRFDDIPIRPNTLKAHCLMKWAQGQGKGHAMSEHLFRAFFDEHKNVGDTDTLADIAREVDMDGDLVKDLLDTARDVKSIQAELEYFAKLGIAGVPFFIYNGRFSVQGGQPAEVHAQALEKAQTLPSKDVMSLMDN